MGARVLEYDGISGIKDISSLSFLTLDKSIASVSASLCSCWPVVDWPDWVLDARLSKRVAISLLTELSSF